jgi:hypothetical protein
MQNAKESRYLDITPVKVALCRFSSVFQLLLARISSKLRRRLGQVTRVCQRRLRKTGTRC